MRPGLFGPNLSHFGASHLGGTVKKLTLLLMACMVSVLAFGQTDTQNQPAANSVNAQPPMLGIQWAQGTPQDQARILQPPRRGVNMTYHGGVIMPTAHIYPIFWGTSWPSYSGDKISGTNSFYAGWNNSNYAVTSDEYTGSNGQVGPTSTANAAVIDGSASTGGNNTGPILNEVCKEISAGNVPLDSSGNGYYPVYVDVTRGSAGFCAWHSVGTCSGQRVEFAFFFKLDGDAGCDPADTQTGHSQGLAAIANVAAHELSEARSDPSNPGAWYDSQGQENGDKCAWTFNVPYVHFSNGSIWKVQGEWSNNAYNNGTGYPNRSGQRGCLDGH
jgi:hypothetical protein